MKKRFIRLSVIILLLLLSLSLAGCGANQGSTAELTDLTQLDGMRIGIPVGTPFDDYVKAQLPNVELTYYNAYPDIVSALKTDKIDAFPVDETVLRLMNAEDDCLRKLDGYLTRLQVGFAFPKTASGEALQAELNEWLAGLKESGELEEICDKWIIGPEEERNVPDYASFSAEKGTLTMVTEGTMAPVSYFRGDELIGLEVDLAARFCEARGYGLEITVMNFSGILMAVQQGDADFAGSGIAITEERKESVLFSDPHYQGGTVMAVLKQEAGAEAGLFTRIAESFEKNFIREDRWKLFVQGIGMTLLITVLTILAGTALGFGLYLMCRKGGKTVNACTGAFLALIQGMPVVVLLLVLYYLVFGGLSMSGILVSVIGFSLTFGAGVLGLLRMGVGAVDPGQYEAAYALGYSDRRTFFRIILPQALPHVMPGYRGEVVGLIKATAVVGYIALQDLTKVGDIVRSRTYEAFFPLIAVTVIYFGLEALLVALVKRLQIRTDPKRRKREDILKGVKTDD